MIDCLRIKFRARMIHSSEVGFLLVWVNDLTRSILVSYILICLHMVACIL